MDSNELTKRAAELEGDLKSRITCYLRVGWIKRGDNAHLVVYYDKRAKLPKKQIPDRWYGLGVRREEIYPPGVKPPDPLWIY